MINTRVIIDSPVKNSSLLYSSGFYCLDPFIFVEINSKKIGWLPSTELEKAKLSSNLTDIFNLTDSLLELKKNNKYPLFKSSILIDFFKKNKLKEVHVPESFPLIEANNLMNHGISVIPVLEPFYKERVVKNEKEIEFIKQTSNINVKVMDEVYKILCLSSITNNNKISYQGKILTSEFLQNYILKKFLEHDLISDSVIVAGGNQGCLPHENGYGELLANTSIIIDIFPRNRKNFYYSDMTRTFCKGKLSEDLKKIYETVLEAQKLGLELVHARENGKKIHKTIQNFFIKKDFKTGVFNGILQGFFHGTGHGLGLDCHESPYISLNGSKLPLNSVVSVEPGLYYINKGAVRIEDLVLVKENKAEILTDYHKKMEIE